MVKYIIYLAGGIDNLLSGLIIFMIINYILDIFNAIVGINQYSGHLIVNKTLKNIAVFIIVIVANIIGKIMGNTFAIRTAVILFYLSNEGLAILKKLDQLGVALPQILVEIIRLLRDIK